MCHNHHRKSTLPPEKEAHDPINNPLNTYYISVTGLLATHATQLTLTDKQTGTLEKTARNKKRVSPTQTDNQVDWF